MNEKRPAPAAHGPAPERAPDLAGCVEGIRTSITDWSATHPLLGRAVDPITAQILRLLDLLLDLVTRFAAGEFAAPPTGHLQTATRRPAPHPGEDSHARPPAAPTARAPATVASPVLPNHDVPNHGAPAIPPGPTRPARRTTPRAHTRHRPRSPQPSRALAHAVGARPARARPPTPSRKNAPAAPSRITPVSLQNTLFPIAHI